MEAPGRTLGSAYGGRAHEQSYSNTRGMASLQGVEYSFPGKVHAGHGCRTGGRRNMMGLIGRGGLMWRLLYNLKYGSMPYSLPMTDITNPLPQCTTGPSLTFVGPRTRAQRPHPGTSHAHVCLAFKSKLHLYPCANSFPLETSPSKHFCHLDLGVHTW